MVDGYAFLQQISTSLIFVIPSLGIALGQALTARTAITATHTQPQAAADIRRNFLLSVAFNETAAILTGIMVIFLLMATSFSVYIASWAHLSILCALGLPSACIGILSALPQRAALIATARQPFFSREILRLMLITISIMQTSALLGFIVSILIKNRIADSVFWSEGISLLASGIAFGCGSIGPLVGLSLFAGAACSTVGKNRQVYGNIVSFTFICQGLIEAPILFSLVVALIILSGAQPNSMACLAAACTIALSTFGPGIASGRIASSACKAIGQQPNAYAAISRTSLLAQTLIDTSPIYGLIISLALLFFV